MFEKEILLKTDFNEVHDRLLLALPGPEGGFLIPEKGDIATLMDAEGNLCQGIVVHVAANRLISILPEWTTWRSAPPTMWRVLPTDLVLRTTSFSAQTGPQFAAEK